MFPTCPNCGNFPRSEYRFLLSAGIPPFACRHCNVPIRGNWLMITLDLLGALLPAGMVTGLVTVVYLERVTLGMEEAIAAGLLGGIATKLFVGRIQMTLGRYVRLRGKNT